MTHPKRSLRAVVVKWLDLEGAKFARVSRCSRGERRGLRYVCVEAERAVGTFAIMFFRHDDGSWCVYPPDCRRPTMKYFDAARQFYQADLEVSN